MGQWSIENDVQMLLNHYSNTPLLHHSSVSRDTVYLN